MIASKIAGTAVFLEDRHVQSFPEFGVERRGAPVKAFLRVADAPIRVRSAIETPDWVIVLDPILLGQPETWSGTGPATRVLFNSRGDDWALPPGLGAVFAVDATGIAVRHGIGTRTTPIVNTAVAGAFARATGLVSIDSVAAAIRRQVPSKPEQNVRAATEAYEETRELSAAAR